MILQRGFYENNHPKYSSGRIIAEGFDYCGDSGGSTRKSRGAGEDVILNIRWLLKFQGSLSMFSSYDSTVHVATE